MDAVFDTTIDEGISNGFLKVQTEWIHNCSGVKERVGDDLEILIPQIESEKPQAKLEITPGIAVSKKTVIEGSSDRIAASKAL